jgi:hypothetical protein
LYYKDQVKGGLPTIIAGGADCGTINYELQLLSGSTDGLFKIIDDAGTPKVTYTDTVSVPIPNNQN